MDTKARYSTGRDCGHMKTNEMAADYLSRAKWCLKEAEMALSGGNFPIVVRRSQEALELATKAVLRYLAIEYPREHDIGGALTFIEEKLPGYLRGEVSTARRLLTELARVRGPAFYGYEAEGLPASKAFSQEYASEVFREVSRLINLYAQFLTGKP